MDDEQVLEKNGKTEKKTTPLQDIMDIFDAVMEAVVLAIFILTITSSRVGFVSGPSMNDTMHEGDRYIVSGLFYTPKNGDIIVFQPGKEFDPENKLWVKRVIATAGETVQIDGFNNRVLINGVELDEPYLSEGTVTYSRGNFVTYPLKVPEGCVFVMGDNRSNSTDSRVIGCVDIRKILGRVLFRMYPFSEIGAVK